MKVQENIAHSQPRHWVRSILCRVCRHFVRKKIMDRQDNLDENTDSVNERKLKSMP